MHYRLDCMYRLYIDSKFSNVNIVNFKMIAIFEFVLCIKAIKNQDKFWPLKWAFKFALHWPKKRIKLYLSWIMIVGCLLNVKFENKSGKNRSDDPSILTKLNCIFIHCLFLIKKISIHFETNISWRLLQGLWSKNLSHNT